MENIHTERLIILRGVLRDEAVSAFARAVEKDAPEDYAHAYFLLLERDMQNSFAAHVADVAVGTENLFAVRAFEGRLGKDIRAAAAHDLRVLQKLAASADSLPPNIEKAVREGLPKIGRGAPPAPFGNNWGSDAALDALSAFHKENGYGIFIGNKAFTFAEGKLKPVRNTPDVTLRDLKDYEAEKKAVEDNIVSFIGGLPYSNMLLYGDKGTGKSSTVHAMLNKYAERGLRAVEIPKEQICSINDIKELLASLPFKFILFIDDLSLEEEDEKVTALKAGLEGSIHEKSANVMIAATSNRRHILKEKFSDRDNSVHARDTMEEQLSLSDRFGLTVCFSSTGKAEYLSIVAQLAADAGLRMPEAELSALAERWALVKGGRSPRRAKQFVNYLYSCHAKNTNPDF